MNDLLTPSEIAGYAEGLRRLARSLVRDAAAADDAVQDTLLQALRTPPRHGATTRAWFHTVLRNRVRRGWRGDTRRRRRELSRPPAQATEEPSERMERTEVAQAVIAALRVLPEAQRVALELRYFEARKPAAIAAHLGIPVETVKTRIKRGREAVRAELDRKHPGAWVMGLVGAFGLEASAVLGATTAGWGLPVALVAVLIAGVGLWNAFESSDPGMDDPGLGSDEALATNEVSTRAAAPSLAVRGLDLATPASASESDARTSASSDPTEERATRDAAGRVVLTDTDGQHLTVPRATLHVAMSGRGSPSPREVHVRQGRFTMKLPAGQFPEFVFLAWDEGAGVVTQPRVPVPGPFSEELVVHVRAVDDVRIHVLDASTGQPLPRTCWQRTGSKRSGLSHPGPGTEHDLTWAASPIRVRATLRDFKGGREPILVGAPGYGWEAVPWDPRSGAPVRVELKPAGRLLLHTPGPQLSQAAHVRVRASDRPGVGYRASWPLEPGGRNVLEGLPAGSYAVRIEIGRWFASPKVLAQQAFTIAAGEEPEITLAYEVPRTAPVVSVRGTFRLPAGWPHDELRVRLTRLAPSAISDKHTRRTLKPGEGLERDQDRPDAYHMDAGRLQPGRYQVDVDSIGYIGEFIVPEGGGDELELEVPPPVELHVDVEGDRGGREPFVGSISWNLEPPKGFDMYSSQTVTRERRGEPFVFTAPAGRIQIHPTSYAFLAEERWFDIRGSEQRIVLRVHANCVIHVIVKHQGKALPWDWAWKIDVEGIGHEVKAGARSSLEDDRGFWVAVGRPGRLRVRVGPIPGFEALPERIVEVGERAPVELLYELTPRR